MQKSNWLVTALLAILFVGCQNQQEAPVTEPENEEDTAIEARDYQADGKKIAMQTFEVMSGELAAAMQEGGVEQAVKYCNVHAYRITDSLSDFYGATIRRATDRPRNPNNMVNEQEAMTLGVWQEKVANGEQLKPALFEDDNQAHFYAPIQIKPQCLNCHGQVGETMPEKNAAFISTLYPEDQATGYKLDDLRGTWHITFKK